MHVLLHDSLTVPVGVMTSCFKFPSLYLKAMAITLNCEPRENSSCSNFITARGNATKTFREKKKKDYRMWVNPECQWDWREKLLDY